MSPLNRRHALTFQLHDLLELAYGASKGDSPEHVSLFESHLALIRTHLKAYYQVARASRMEEVAKNNDIIQAALEEAYRSEIVRTQMEHSIGPGQEYYDIEDWKTSKLIEWTNAAKEKRAEDDLS